MPKELPRPMSTTMPRNSHGGIAGRHRQRVNAIKRQIKAQKRASSEQMVGRTRHASVEKSKGSPTRLSLTLFYNPFSFDNFLPCPSFVGPFSLASSFRRVSQALRPFVRLPLRPDVDNRPPENPETRSRADSVDTDSDIDPYDETTIRDLAPLSPLPWSPLHITPVDSSNNQDKRSSTLVSSSSTGTHHISMFDMYMSGKLVSQYPPLSPPGKPAGIVKRHTWRHRKSTLTRSSTSLSRLSNSSSNTVQTFLTASTSPDSQPPSPSTTTTTTTCSYSLPVCETSICLVQTITALGSISQASTAAGSATDLLYAALDKYGLPTPPSSPVTTRSETPSFIMPDPLQSQSNNPATTGSPSHPRVAS